MRKMFQDLANLFAPKEAKDPLTEVSGKIAVFIGKYPPMQRVILLKGIQEKVVADLHTEGREGEEKMVQADKAWQKITPLN